MASSLEILRMNDELSFSVGGFRSDEERIIHGIPMPVEDWPPEEEHAMAVDLPEWDYAADVV
jgi:hypothetical protein